jgi:hypothetical protein
MPRFPLDDVLQGLRSLGEQLRRNPETQPAVDWLADRVDQLRERAEPEKTLEELQADLDAWLREYNEERTHQGRWCFGKTPMQTFRDSLPLAKEKMLAA